MASDKSTRKPTILGVRPGERAPVAWSFVYFFCVLSSYFMLRSIRETVGSEFGGANIPWLFTGTFIAMLLIAPVFGWIASRYPRRKFLPWIYYFFISNILLFWLGFSAAGGDGSSVAGEEREFAWLAVSFFIWLSVFNLFVVSVFWSFMADIYNSSQSRRLFGLISAGGSAGAVLGPLLTGALVVPIGFANVLPISAGLLLLAVYCIRRLRRWVESEHREDLESTAASGEAMGGTLLEGAVETFRSRFLLLISVGSVIASLMGTAQYIFLADLMQASFPDVDARTRAFAMIDAAINGLALIGQLIVVKHAVKKLGVGWTLTILPIVSLLGFAVLSLNPGIVLLVILQITRRSVGFSLSKPCNDMLYAILPVAQKYKAKNFIDTAIYRGGDVLGVWAVAIVYPFGLAVAAALMLPFAVIWALCTLKLGRDYVSRDRALKARDDAGLAPA